MPAQRWWPRNGYLKRSIVLGAVIVALCGGEGPVLAEDDPVDYRVLADLSLTELMSTEVTSVAGFGQGWFETPAAVYVITREELLRSGHRSIAEALRLAPGMTVLRGDSNSWAIGARGFNIGFTNKLLVLIDGRTTYDLLFSGTLWDVQDVLLEDLDRIEVIRGPGATLWGANAVNGVINVTTKSARDTQGLYIGGGIGTEERGFGEARYGFQIDDDSWARVWGKWFERDGFELPGGSNGPDDWDMGRGGVRYDREGDDDGFLTLQAEAYGSDRIGDTSGPPRFFADGRAEGAYALFRVGQEVHGGDGWALQGYYDRTTRVNPGGFQVDRDTLDLDFRHHFKWGEVHQTVWGAGHRYSTDRVDGVFTSGTHTYDPRERGVHTLHAFVQDTITLVPEELFVMIGSKVEHNDFTGFEFQPSVRAWWTPDETQTLWGAVSRPVRTPSRTEDDLVRTVAPVLDFRGNRETEAEELWAYELGYRKRLTRDLTADAALFYNDYDNMVSLETLSAPGEMPRRLTFGNRGAAESYGAEVAANWRVAPNWELRASYSFIDIHQQSSSLDAPEGATPQNQAQLRSSLDITRDLDFNAALYYFDNIPALDVEHNVRLDLGVTWRVNEHFEVSVWGQNLLDPSHAETGRFNGYERGGYVMGVFRF